MSGVSKGSDKSSSLDFKGFLKDLKDWDSLLDDKDQKMKRKAAIGDRKQGSRKKAGKFEEDKGPPKNISATEAKKRDAANPGFTSFNHDNKYVKYSEPISQFASSFSGDEKLPDAASEKELGNEYFKQKKYNEAIDCYSRSIVLSPTAVAFANRAMAYIKVKRFEEAENDCTEALNLDDRYVKAYSRRFMARKGLGKFRGCMEDAEFAIRLEPNNQELQKQYTEAKGLLEKENGQRRFGTSHGSIEGTKKTGNSEMAIKGAPTGQPVLNSTAVGASTSAHTNNADSIKKTFTKPFIVVNGTENKSISVRVDDRGLVNGSHGSSAPGSHDRDVEAQRGVSRRKKEMDASIQDLASHAASLVMASAPKQTSAPKSAYEFEVSWRALSDSPDRQACLLKTISPASLPQIFKNALSAPVLVEIIKCTAMIFREDTDFAVSILDNLTKVLRFDMIVLCLSAVDRAEIHHLWEQVFSSKDIQAHHVETLSRLRGRFCHGE